MILFRSHSGFHVRVFLTLWLIGTSVGASQIGNVGFEDIDPLEFTDEMRRAAIEGAGDGGPVQRLQRLQQYLFDPDRFPFDYETYETVTAAEAFALRRGNCVSFTSMFIALARSIGIHAQPALVNRRGDTEIEGDLRLVRNHIVAIYRDGPRAIVFDFYLARQSPPVGVQPIEDAWVTAIFHNNLGVDALRAGRTESARSRFEYSARIAPGYVATYGNLGVALRRGGDIEGAIDSYIIALHLDPRDTSARENLFNLLVEATRSGAESRPESRDTTRRAGFELALGHPARAARLYRRLHREQPERAEPLVALARCELMRGRMDSAREALSKALGVEPANAAAERLSASLDRLDRWISTSSGSRR